MEAHGGGLSVQRFVREKGLAASVAELIEPVLEDLGFRLVRVHVSGHAGGHDGPTLQIMAERPDGTISVGDCEALSRQLSPLLDAHDPIAGGYRLEISSPGIDRPLVRASDFADWAGFEAKIELSQAVDNRKRYRGVLEGFVAGEVRIACERNGLGQQVLGFPIALIAAARLVLTDALVREALQRSKKSQPSKAAPSARPKVNR